MVDEEGSPDEGAGSGAAGGSGRPKALESKALYQALLHKRVERLESRVAGFSEGWLACVTLRPTERTIRSGEPMTAGPQPA